MNRRPPFAFRRFKLILNGFTLIAPYMAAIAAMAQPRPALRWRSPNTNTHGINIKMHLSTSAQDGCGS
jgi:hypothetical protein